jgi:hypothetical protein
MIADTDPSRPSYQLSLLEEIRGLRAEISELRSAIIGHPSPAKTAGQIEPQPQQVEVATVQPRDRNRSRSRANWERHYRDIIPVILDMTERGIGTSGIARYLNDSGFKTLTGQSFFSSSVGAIRDRVAPRSSLDL